MDISIASSLSKTDSGSSPIEADLVRLVALLSIEGTEDFFFFGGDLLLLWGSSNREVCCVVGGCFGSVAAATFCGDSSEESSVSADLRFL